MILGLTRWVLRHRLVVLIGWLVLTAAGAVAVTPAINAMTDDFGALPGRPGYETNQQILHTYVDGGAADPLVLVVTLPEGTTVDSVRPELARTFDGLAAGARLVSYPDTGDRGLVSADGRTTFALLYPEAEDSFPPYARALPALEQALAHARVAGEPVRLTGTDALFVQSSDASGPGLLAETLVAGLSALVVLVVVFGSALAILPLVMAAVAILVTFGVVWGLTAVTDVSFVVQFLVGLIGLGVAIDYALLITSRWREERAGGADDVAAVERAMVTAGSAVVFSGVTVAVALAVLVVLPVPFLRAMGFAGLLIPLFSVLVATTLLPVLLFTVGPRLRRWGRTGPRREHTRWERWARLVVRRPKSAALAALLILAVLMAPVFDLRLGAPAPESMASSGPAREALTGLTAAGIGSEVLSPEYLLVDGDPADAVSRARAVPGVRAVLTPDDRSWRRDGTSLVAVLVEEQAARERLAGALPDIRIGGTAAQGRDFVDAVYGNALLVVALLVLVTVVLLVRVFRSVVLAVKAVVLNAISVTATFGLLVLAWQHGLLSEPVWGIPATGALTEWVPVMVFAFLFGLSIDYEVFILARMREEYDATGSTPRAAEAGIARTGRLVTGAAVILLLAFISLAATPGTEVKVFATALGLGILLDATVVRALLVPALVVLFGRWNWWLPRGLGRARTVPAARKVR
jgi:RND superfamily putative drug exporter